jgi:purine-nucleoside/S-methyl-5'-thioadenosine phosphorylase / adenosine deaminase
MIAGDQPTIFGDDIIVALSSTEDGNMSFKHDEAHTALENRKRFLDGVGIDINDTTLVQVSFDGVTDFARYVTLTDSQKGKGMFDPNSDLIGDGLVVTTPGHAIFLPVADCSPTVIYDPKHRILMVSHLGRQSTEIFGARKSVEYLQREFDTNPLDLKVWIGPAVGKESYQLHHLENKGIYEAILEQLHEAGVPQANIEVSSIDTATNPDYFSHSAFLKGTKSVDSRFTVVAAMRVQGEPAS